MNVLELKAKRTEASKRAKLVKCPIQHEVLRREVIRLTALIKEAQA